jgi:hypothetical protein
MNAARTTYEVVPWRCKNQITGADRQISAAYGLVVQAARLALGGG